MILPRVRLLLGRFPIRGYLPDFMGTLTLGMRRPLSKKNEVSRFRRESVEDFGPQTPMENPGLGEPR